MFGVVKGLALDAAASPFGSTVVSEPDVVVVTVVTDEPFPPGSDDDDESPPETRTTIRTMRATIPSALEITSRRLIFTKEPFECSRHAKEAEPSRRAQALDLQLVGSEESEELQSPQLPDDRSWPDVDGGTAQPDQR